MKLIRITLMLLLTGIFLSLAYFLFDRQQNQFSFLSFQLEQPATSIIVTDIDRLVSKISDASEIEDLAKNEALSNAVTELLKRKNLRFNAELGKSCILSFNGEDFVLAFSDPDLDFYKISDILTKSFGSASVFEENTLTIGAIKLEARQFGVYSVLSTSPIVPERESLSYFNSNADYIVLEDSTRADRYILANNRKFKVWNEKSGPVRGAAISHESFITKVPSGFTSLTFYGSKRLLEDKHSFFNEPSEEAFNWMNNGVLILKKDSFELMLAPQNDLRDLKIILEEQTLDVKGDSAVLEFLNVKNHEIMPFVSNFNWQQNIPELDDELTLYTEFQNFNVLANSLRAMRWYLSEIQLGNLIGDNEAFINSYKQATPFKCHYVRIENNEEALFFETGKWMGKTNCIRTETTFSQSDSSQNKNIEGFSFEPVFAPTNILPFKEGGVVKLLINNQNKLALYNASGELEWQKDLPSKIVLPPQLIDTENDGGYEIALFLEGEFSVINGEGKTLAGFPKKIGEKVKGGLCANYDNNYNYRFFVVTANNVICLNEKGEVVTGWTFTNPGVALTGAVAYCQIDGIDYLTFKAVNDRLFVLNRRGENKFGTETASKLPNESEFITGKNESVLHKLGYSKQYIYNRYLKDSYTDSIKLDKRVNAVTAKWIMLDKPVLLIEEPTRIMLFDEFGYVQQEILKPEGATKFLGIEALPDIYYVFFNNTNNSLYLLNRAGKMTLSHLSNGSEVYGTIKSFLFTFDGQTIKEHKLN